jgi:hypothetical protein
MLKFYCAVSIINRDHLEQIAVEAAVPVANFRGRYPIVLVFKKSA